MNIAGEGRQARRRSKSRDALVGAAETLFGARGPDAVTIDDIVASADLAKGTFYNHFADKDALTAEVARMVRASIERRVDAANEGISDPAARTARALCVYAAFAVQKPDRARALLRLALRADDRSDPLNAGLAHDLDAGFSAGRFSGIGRVAAVMLVVGTVQQIVLRLLHVPEGAAEIARDLAVAQLKGLGVKPGDAERTAAKAAAEILGDIS